MASSASLVIRNARLANGEYADVSYNRSRAGDPVQVTLSPCSPSSQEGKSSIPLNADGSLAPLASCSTLEGAGTGREELDAKGNLLLPGGLVHPHVHLDKCYLLDRCHVEDGSFQEALTGTNRAKEKFEMEDLLERGRRLLSTSISHGVVSCRAHVEVDPTVNLLCLDAGLQLKREFAGRCAVNLVVFAQDPLFYRSDPPKQERMHALLAEAVARPGVNAVGSAPYVEKEGQEAEEANARFVFDLAQSAGLDVDFHLDYNVSHEARPLLWKVLKLAQERRWDVAGRSRRLTIGHCTRIALFSETEIERLRKECEALDVSFVALPPSDLYMQGREVPYGTRTRATLPGLELVHRGISCAVGVNNVANLFTVQGDADPLALLPLLVGVWQSATPNDVEALLAMVSTSAGFAAGLDGSSPQSLPEASSMASSYTHSVLLDGCRDVQEAVFSPPFGRTAIFDGRIVGRRTVQTWVAEK